MGPLIFRIRKGTHVSHFHERCASWPDEGFYEQDKPLWWGNLCEECSRLADADASQSRIARKRNAGTGC